MASNHGNLYITLLSLVLRVLRSTHAKVNGMEEEKGKNRDGNGDRNGERRGGREQGRQQGQGRKRSPLVRDV